MKKLASLLIALTIAQFVTYRVIAEETRDDRIDDAIKRGLAIVQNAAKNYPAHRQCFSCHHQTLPLLAMQEARDAGFAIDEEVFDATKQHTLKSFSSRLEQLRGGRGIGGQASTVSYGLWALDIAKHPPDETTAAMVAFLLRNQRDDGRWAPPSNRPPLEESQISATVLSAYYMRRFATEHQQEDVDKSIAKARTWLESAPLESQEDRAMRLWQTSQIYDQLGFKASQDYFAASIELTDSHGRVLHAQRADGGWSQIPDMESDAYATGQTLYIFMKTGIQGDERYIKKGVDYLLHTQQDDGSWLVETRSKPVQVYFDNGDPHGKSQFISVAATSWAVAALARVQQASKD